MSEEVAPATRAWYVYGVVRAGERQEGIGVASRPVELVEEADVAALASVVPAEEFAESSLRDSLNDREWLERTAREHEEVLERALATTPVIPFRLCTIYETRAHVRDFLATRGAALRDLLRRFEGTIELGVKAYFDSARFDDAPERDTPATGRDYLLRRQRERALAEEATGFKAQCARASHDRLAAAAEEARANSPQAPELSGRTEEMVLNAAYLVRRDDDRLHETVTELESLYGPRGVTYEVTGPWPPYNFVPREVAEP